MESNQKQSYYKENLPNLIDRLKNSVEKTLDIIDKDIADDLSDDKYLNVLKARRQASEDVIWTLKRIDELENELLGIDEVVNEEIKQLEPINPTKKFARKKVTTE
jgi:hypothetical protein